MTTVAEPVSTDRAHGSGGGLAILSAPDASYGGKQGRDCFAGFDIGGVRLVAEEPVSTFPIDVDTASYAFVRASLNDGVLPPMDAVRVEELVNHFPYDYPGPENPDVPFAASVSLMPAPWNDAARLMHVGIKGYAPGAEAAPRVNLVFLVDTSASIDEPGKLPLLVESVKRLVGTLAPEDTVAIVSYGGFASTVLAPTPAADRERILSALERLAAGGSTTGAVRIRQAYPLAGLRFVEGGVNRVILATDGDFNADITDFDELEAFIARKRESGVSLSVLGFGMGNDDGALMRRLARSGNGNAVNIDSAPEARKALVEEATPLLFPIAKDVKIQVEFNPAAIGEYRLLGYETRLLAREDFRNERVHAGEVGSGHTVTAIYELVPAGSGGERIEPTHYGRAEAEVGTDTRFEDAIAFMNIRFKRSDAGTNALVTRAVTSADAFDSVTAAPQEARFVAAVAGFGRLLRGGRDTDGYGYDDIIALAQGARGEDP